MNAIETLNLTKKYKNKTAVDNLSLTVKHNELFALLGVNGAGKTTTIKMLSCVLAPTSGDAVLLGDSIISNTYSVKKKINISPQETAVARNLTVAENLEMMAGIYGYGKKAAKEKAINMIERLGLGENFKIRAKTLSGGMQRRLSIAMSLISEPAILFLDEPTLGLDVIVRRELWSIIKKIKEKSTIVLTTHYMEEAEALSDRIGIMSGGRLTAVGTADELKQKAYAKSFEDAFITLVGEGDRKK